MNFGPKPEIKRKALIITERYHVNLRESASNLNIRRNDEDYFFGDIHEDTSNLIKIKSELENTDLIVISGDLTNYHGKAEAKKVLESIKNITNICLHSMVIWINLK